MTTIKTDDLTLRQINMLVAVAEGWVPPGDPLVRQYMDRWKVLHDDGRHWPRLMWLDSRDLTEAGWTQEPRDYCGVWAFAGPIIDRERMTFELEYPRDPKAGGLIATIVNPERNQGDAHGFGATHAEAAMRAYVKKRHGYRIDTTDKPWLLEADAS